MTENTIITLGTGHSESLERNNSSFMIKSWQGNLLIDCGYTIKYALHKQRMTIENIDAIFITHVHGDHVFGLERVAYESLFKYKKKVDLFFHESIYEELWDQTLKGSLSKIGEGAANFDDYFNLNIIKGNSFTCFNNRFDIFEVKHTPNKPTFGFNMENKLLYSADTKAIPEIISEQNFIVGIHDVTLAKENPVHATLDSLLNEYDESIRKKLWLTSYEDSFESVEEEISKEFKGLLKEGQEFKL